MTNEELIAAIRNKVEGQFSVFLNLSNSSQEYGYHKALEFVLSVLSDIEETEKPDVDLEKEIEEYFPESAFYTGWNYDDMEEVARHFYELGLKSRK